MIRRFSLYPLSLLLVCGLWISGCGGAKDKPEGSTVITPPAQEEAPAAEETAESTAEPAASEPAEPEPAAANEPQPEVATTPSEPEAEPMPETAEAEPAASDVASDASAGTQTPVSVELGAEPGGSVFKGRVIVKGTVSVPKPIVADKDAFCIDLGDIPDQTLVVSNDGGLKNVFVWLQKVPSGVDVPPVPDTPVILDNLKCAFEPHAFLLRVGQTMLVKNGDPTGHNTHTSPLRNNAFNQLVPPNDRNGVEVVYDREELLPISTKCDIHPWMSNYHFPVDHPWAAVTDENGNFEITGLPAGDLTFRLWHERTGWVERKAEVTIADGQTVSRDFEVDAGKLAN